MNRKIKALEFRSFCIWLFCCVFLVYLGLQIACTTEDYFEHNIKIEFKIQLPNQDMLKSAPAITGVKRVTLTVSSETMDPEEFELVVSGNFATGTIQIDPGNNLTFMAKAMDENDIVQWQGSTTMNVENSFSIEITLSSVPPTINIISASVEGKSVNLSWLKNSDPDFSRYEIYRSLSVSKDSTLIKSINVADEINFTDTTAIRGNTYSYSLIVLDTEGFPAYSKASASIPESGLNASILKIDFVSNTVNLSWTKSTYPNFVRYELYRSQIENQIGAIIYSSSTVSDTLFTDNQILRGTNYFYTLISFDNEGTNKNSNTVLAETASPIVTPAILTGTLNDFVFLHWSQNPDSDFKGYELYRSLSTNDLGAVIYTTEVVSDTVFTDSDIEGSNTYYYTLVTRNANDSTAKSNTVEIKNTYVTASILYGTYDGYIYLEWTKNPDSDFARYDLYRSESIGSIGTLIHTANIVTDTLYTDSDISKNNIYYYTLVVYNTSDLSANSNIAAIETGTPPTPSILHGAYDGYIFLDWTKNPDSDYARYDLYRSQLNGSIGTKIHSTNIVTDTVYTDSDLSENSTYYYTLVVYDTGDLSSNSNVFTVQTEGNTPIPSILDGAYDGYIFLDWTKNTDSDFARYELYRSQLNGSLGTLIHTTNIVTDTLYTDNNLSENSTYYYTLVVYNTGNLSSNSNVFTVQTEGNPPTPGILYGEYNENVYLTWTQNQDADFARYELYRADSENSPGNRIFTTSIVTELAFADDSISAGGSYYYTLFVFDTQGLSAGSNVYHVNIPSDSIQASTLKLISIGFDKAILSWDQYPNPDFEKYELYRSYSENTIGEMIFSSFASNQTAFTDDSVSQGVTYYYSLVVYNNSGLSATSNILPVEIPIDYPAKSNIYGEYYDYGETDDRVYLYWDQNNEDDFAKYELYRSESQNSLGDMIYSTPYNHETYFNDNYVSEGKNYYYRIVVYDVNGIHIESDVLLINIPISYPTSVYLNYDNYGNDLYLFWDQNNDYDFNRYELYRSTSENILGTLVYTTTERSDLYYYESLNVGYIYYYTLVIYDNDGFSTKSNVIAYDLKPPAASVLNGEFASCQVNFSWTQNSDNNFYYYELYRSETENELGTSIFYTYDVGETTFTDADEYLCYYLEYGGTYYYTLVVYDYDDLSSKSNVIVISAN